MTSVQLCVLFNFKICGTFPPVFKNIFFGSRRTMYKCVVSAFIQRSWRIRNWTIVDLLAHRISFVGLKGHEYVTIAFSGGISTNVYKLFMVSFSYYCRLSQLRIMFKFSIRCQYRFFISFSFGWWKIKKIKTWKQTPYHSILFHIFRQLVDFALFKYLYYRTHSGSIKTFSGSENFYWLKRLKRKLSMALYERKCWRGNGNICQEVRKIYKTRIQSKCEKA